MVETGTILALAGAIAVVLVAELLTGRMARTPRCSNTKFEELNVPAFDHTKGFDPVTGRESMESGNE